MPVVAWATRASWLHFLFFVFPACSWGLRVVVLAPEAQRCFVLLRSARVGMALQGRATDRKERAAQGELPPLRPKQLEGSCVSQKAQPF